ncbi:MAG: hypothetical protein HGA30_05050 [Anaerolineales bacterium]|jgi:hypothetical protein|nr:hypothetical protein [Anaerolineales bacterium]
MPRRYLLPFLWTLVLASACAPAPAPTPFIPPTSQAPLIEPTLIIIPTPTTDLIRVIPLLPTAIPTLDQSNCVNGLSFIEDLTIPDNSFVPFGSSVDKQWRVENSGTCNWTSGYRLRHTGGAVLGAPEEVALYPARSGTQVTIQINFTAPFEEGLYESAWQAFDPNGLAFGDPIYIRILVSP